MEKNIFEKGDLMSKIFEGITVVDLSNNVAGPSSTAMLADYGATIIKVEKPKIGDDNRAYGPFIEGSSFSGMGLNRGKQSIVLNTKEPEGLAILKDLIKKADVLVETFRPGYMKRIGLSYEEIIEFNPDVIMCSISGYGQNGPLGQAPGYDLIIQATSGMMDATGFSDGPPTKIGSAIADYSTGLTAYGAMVSALFHREKTGEGQYIDIALFESLINMSEFTDAALNGAPVPSRSGNHHPTLNPFGLFEGTDGYVMLGALSEKLWESLCKLMGREDLFENTDYHGAGKRAENQEVINPLIESWMQTFDTIDEVVELLNEVGIPNGKLATFSDLADNPQLKARNMISEVKTNEISAGKIKMRSPVMHFSKTPGIIEFTPALAEHTDTVLSNELNFDKEKIDELRKNGIIE